MSEPDIRTPEEARRFAQKLRLIWLSLGISDCSMEEGSMRVDANVSIRRARRDRARHQGRDQEHELASRRCTTGSSYEIVRQAELVEAGGTVVQETRHWDVGAKRTSTLRSKEEAHDYRYFPEPDMVPFEFTDEFIDEIRGAPARAARRQACAASWPTTGCRAHDATVLTERPRSRRVLRGGGDDRRHRARQGDQQRDAQRPLGVPQRRGHRR